MKKTLALVLLASPFCLSAQGYKVHAQGQIQQAMGNTGTGLVQDAATVFYNPGGMSFLEGNSVSLGGNAIIAKSTYFDLNSYQTSESETPLSTPVTLYATYGLDGLSSSLGGLTAGLGVYTGFGSSIAYPAEWQGRYIVNSQKMTTLSIQPSVSYKFNDQIGIGAGFVYTMGKLTQNVDIPVIDVNGKVSSSSIEGNFKGGFGFNAGVYYTPTDELSIGVTYRSGMDMTLNDKAGVTFNDIPATLKDSFPSGGVTMTIPLPQNLGVGVSYKLSEKLLLAVDFNFVGFKVFDTLKVDFENNTGSLEDKEVVKGFQNAYSFHLGGQYEIIENLNARAGLRYVTSSVSEGFVSPDAADAGRLVYSLGGGYQITDELSVDASYTFEPVSVKETTHEVYQIKGSYKTYASYIGLSVAYKF